MHLTVPIRPHRVCSWAQSPKPASELGSLSAGSLAGRMSQYWINEGQSVFKSPGRISSGDLS